MSKFKLNLNKGSKNNVQLFGINEDRAKELCNLIDKVERENPSWEVDQVIDHVSEKVENQQELNFIIATYFGEHGRNIGIQQASQADYEMEKPSSLYDRTMNPTENFYKVRALQMD